MWSLPRGMSVARRTGIVITRPASRPGKRAIGSTSHPGAGKRNPDAAPEILGGT